MSEPGAGTDVLGMSTTARKSEDGRSYVINGQKMWITNGTLDGKGTGDVFLVYAKTGKLAKEVSMFVVEKGMEGFRLGQKIGMWSVACVGVCGCMCVGVGGWVGGTISFGYLSLSFKSLTHISTHTHTQRTSSACVPP